MTDDIVHRAVEISYSIAAHHNYSPADTEIENLAHAVLVLVDRVSELDEALDECHAGWRRARQDLNE